jgi:hypothetical protein
VVAAKKVYIKTSRLLNIMGSTITPSEILTQLKIQDSVISIKSK